MNRNMERERVVYGLHAGDGMFGYIGSTEVNAKTRWWEHRSRARAGHNAPVYEWMRESGVDQIDFEIIERVTTDEDVLNAEARVIAQYLMDGHPLANQKALDGVPDSMSEASKRRIGDPKKGKATWIKGKTGLDAGWTPERRAAQSARIAATRAAA